MVRSGRIGYEGDANRGLGGRMNRGVGRYGQDGDGYRLSHCKDNVANVTLGMEPNATFFYATGLEHHHPIMSTLGDPGVQLDI